MALKNVLTCSAFALLAACGGGGGDSGAATGSGSTGTAGNGGGSSSTSITVTPNQLNVSAVNTSTAAPTASVVFAVTNLPAGVVYLDGAHSLNGMYEAGFSSGTSEAGGQINIRFRDPQTLDPGVYTDTLVVVLCRDEDCNSIVAQQQVTSRYTVTGTARPRPTMTLSSTSVSAQSLPFGPSTSAQITMTVSNIDPHDVGLKHLVRTNNAIADVSLWVNGANTGILTVTFKSPSTLGRGSYDDTITLNACDYTTYDCQLLLQGPQTIPVHYVVSDTIAGTNGYTVKFVNRSANDLAWDVSRQRIYYSQRLSANGLGIGVVNPIVAAYETLYGTPAEANTLALSGDGQYLYAGIDSTATVRQLSLPSFSTSAVLALGSSSRGPIRALDIQVSPLQSNTAAVAIGLPPAYMPNCHEVAVFDGSIARPISTIYTPGLCATALQWASASLLYANDAGSYPSDLNALSLDASGVSLATVYPGSGWEFVSRIQLAGGRIYSDRGAVFNTTTLTTEPGFVMPTISGPMSAVADPSANRYFLLWSPDVGSSELISYDLTTRQQIATLPLPGVNISTGRGAVRLIRWGRDGLAFVTADDRIALISGSFVTP